MDIIQNSVIMETSEIVKKHHRNSRIVFWVAQVIGSITIIALLLFVGGNLLTELIDPDIDSNLREDFMLYIFLLSLVFVAVSIIISWYKSKIGAFLVIACTILAYIIWGIKDLNVLLLLTPLLCSGLLLIFYSYYKDWILNKKVEADE